jgi:Glucosamine 6-phosphate synthetase, contains amidotransferase and phosphosugar isomerase domains
MQNAHPHVSSNGEIVIVHNGIVENYLSLREELSAEGAVFHSETDTETIVLLIEHYYAVTQDLLRAVQETLKRIKGAHGIVVMSSREPDKLIAARLGNAGGVAIGRGKGEMFIASDLPAIMQHTHEITFLDSEQIAVVQQDSLEIQTLAGVSLEPGLESHPLGSRSPQRREYTGILCRKKFMSRYAHSPIRW